MDCYLQVSVLSFPHLQFIQLHGSGFQHQLAVCIGLSLHCFSRQSFVNFDVIGMGDQACQVT
jgi:hypothetical protein